MLTGGHRPISEGDFKHALRIYRYSLTGPIRLEAAILGGDADGSVQLSFLPKTCSPSRIIPNRI